MMTASYLALDPGHTTGWATFDDEGTVLDKGQFGLEDAVDILNNLINGDLKHIIVEDYKNYHWKKQKSWSRNETSKVIGKIETLAELSRVPVALQPASVRPIGYMWAGTTQPSNHAISHEYDAYAHGVYWLQSNGIRPVGKALKHD
jgi:hypothetical protein